MRAPESITLGSNVAAGTYTGTVLGGRYLVLLDCTGTPALQMYAQNVSGTYVKVGSALTTATGGSFEIALPPGQVQAIIGTSTANTLVLARIPSD